MITKNKIKLVSNNKLKQKGGATELCYKMVNPNNEELLSLTQEFYGKFTDYCINKNEELYNSAINLISQNNNNGKNNSGKNNQKKNEKLGKKIITDQIK